MSLTARSWSTALVCCAALFLVTPAFGLVDADGDGYSSDIDCDDMDLQVWSIPEETSNLRFDFDKTTLFWDPPLDLGGMAVLYDTLRTSLRYDFACDTAECTDSDGLATDSTDPTLPPPGGVFYYVSRAENACGAGSIGSRSNGAIRAALTRDCENLCNLTNSGFEEGLLGWILEGDEGCTISVPVIADDALHGDAFPLGVHLSCGGLMRLWQVAVVDVDAQSSVRVRVDVKMMWPGYSTGPVNLRVYAGVAPFYDQTLIGNHEFVSGSFAETTALNGTTTLPLGTWYAYTSDDIRPLIPAGTQFLRVELWRQGGFGRVDNVRVVLDDAAVPAGTANPDPVSGHPPLLVQFTGTCSDGDGVCVGTTWDFGDGPTAFETPGGGGTSVELSPSYVFTGSETYHASLTVEDDRGAARSVFATVTPENLAPTASIQVAPESGPSPLEVQFTAVTSDDHLIVSHAWSFGNGETSTAVNPLHTYAAAGTYLATLTVTDDHGATATAYHAVVATELSALTNVDFSDGTSGWILEGDEGCTISVPVIADDALHGDAFPLGVHLSCGGLIRLWQVAVVDVDAQSSVRVRVDVKMMWPGYSTGPVNLRVYAGVAPFYDQTLIGNHEFVSGSFAETTALNGTTTLPLGTWYAYTSDDIRPLIPAGTQFLRVELWRQGGFGRVDNVRVVLDDAAVPAGTANPDPVSGHPPLLVQFTGTCSDGDGVCVGTTWDFGDGPTAFETPGGGGTSVELSPSYVFTGSETYHASLTVEDDRGAARSVFATVTPENLAPTASIQVAPESGPSPLEVQFTAVTSDDHLIVSHAWSFGNGETSTAVNPLHTYAAAGTYLATLTVTDDHGATATAYHAVVATELSALTNVDFSDGTSGWILEGDEGCTISVPVIADDALHGDAFPLGVHLSCGGLIRLWQVAVVDVDAQSSVRVRVDVKMMWPGYSTGPVNLRVYAGVAPFYDQTLIGNHEFVSGSFAETTALNGTTTLPLGTWYAYTSDDIRPLIPAGTQFLRVELWRQGGFGRVDNVRVVLDDAAVPAGSFNANPTNGPPPLFVEFSSSCSDGDGVCVGTTWDFGDGPTAFETPGGGTASTSASPSNTFADSRTYHVSLTVEDDRGAAHSTLSSVSTTANVPPTVSIQAVPSFGDAPLQVQFTALASDSDGSIVSWAWNFGDGQTSTTVNPLHTYGQPGTFQVTLSVTDDQGAFATAQYTIVVTVP